MNNQFVIARHSKFGALAFGLLLAVYAFAAGNLPPQTSIQSGVTVKVTPRSLAGAEWEFEVVFDTHSGELKDDLLTAAVLVADGRTPSSPTGWQGDGPGGHHRKGVLRFKPPAASPASIELRLQRPGEAAPRVFRWQLR
ncbi:MAG: hypothetical protein A2W21_01990 [Betaproteobacteria bacterium RBG_16_66_20]|nr:MAG: hypothetical protein A2W21_01990 [Betaproteobacteria bacterium RBG_16_66_20]